MIPKIVFSVMTCYFVIHLWRIACVAFLQYHKATTTIGRIVHLDIAANKGAVAVLATIGIVLGFLSGYFLGAS